MSALLRVLLVPAFTVILASPVRAESKDLAVQWVGCAKCHHAPDSEFATDKAWLNQLSETG